MLFQGLSARGRPTRPTPFPATLITGGPKPRRLPPAANLQTGLTGQQMLEGRNQLTKYKPDARAQERDGRRSCSPPTHTHTHTEKVMGKCLRIAFPSLPKPRAPTPRHVSQTRPLLAGLALCGPASVSCSCTQVPSRTALWPAGDSQEGPCVRALQQALRAFWVQTWPFALRSSVSESECASPRLSPAHQNRLCKLLGGNLKKITNWLLKLGLPGSWADSGHLDFRAGLWG